MVVKGGDKRTVRLHPLLGSSFFPRPEHSATVRTQLQREAAGGAKAEDDAMSSQGRSRRPLPGPPATPGDVSISARASRKTRPHAPSHSAPGYPYPAAQGVKRRRSKASAGPVCATCVTCPAFFPGLLAPPLRRRTASLWVRPFLRFEFSPAKPEK